MERVNVSILAKNLWVYELIEDLTTYGANYFGKLEINFQCGITGINKIQSIKPPQEMHIHRSVIVVMQDS